MYHCTHILTILYIIKYVYIYVHIFWLYVPCTQIFWLCVPCTHIYDYMPKSVQEKRTEVLGNKVDRMWVSNAFSEWKHVKSSTSEGRRQCCSSFLRNLTFSVICDIMLNITSPHHCAANHAVSCKIPTKLRRCDPHEYYQVNFCSVSHKTAWDAWFLVMDDIQHTASLEQFIRIKSNIFCNN